MYPSVLALLCLVRVALRYCALSLHTAWYSFDYFCYRISRFLVKILSTLNYM